MSFHEEERILLTMSKEDGPARDAGEPGPGDEPTPEAPAPEPFGDLYAELRDLARQRMRRERGSHTLDPTAVVHEAWMRMQALEQPVRGSRSGFLAAAAGTMRRVLVDHARKHHALKRDQGRRPAELSESMGGDARLSVGSGEVDTLALEAALAALGHKSQRQMRVIELRFFGGLSIVETAEALDVSTDTVKRDWRVARAWLHRELERGERT